MTSLELADKLTELEITEGYVIRNGFIVSWDNKTEVPSELLDYVQLEGVDNGNDDQ